MTETEQKGSDHTEEEGGTILAVCWRCHKDMTLSAHYLRWECSCGFSLHEHTCVALYHDFQAVTVIGNLVLGKRNGKGKFHVMRTKQEGES